MGEKGTKTKMLKEMFESQKLLKGGKAQVGERGCVNRREKF